MKKVLFIFTAILILALGTNMLMAQSPMMVIDGNKDTFYNALTGPSDGYLQIRSSATNPTNGAPRNDADLSAKIWAAWDTTWLYMYVEVTDDTLKATSVNAYQNDCMELKFDPQPKDSVVNYIWDTRLTALGKITPGTTGAVDSLNSVADSMKQWIRTTTSDGYVLELAIKWAAIGRAGERVSAAVDSVYGMAINIHDNDALTRSATIMWAAVMNDGVWNTSKFLGTVKFLAGNKLSFTARNNMTGFTNPIKFDGTDVPLAVERIDASVPNKFSLDQNYPNPFNPSTVISYQLSAASNVRLTVYDMLGRKMALLVNEKQNAGTHQVRWNAANMPSGMYFYKIETGSESQVRKMMLLK
jgi:hypothetical protein